MGEIKHLPEAIRSSVRSAIILFDLTRVVEELIFNSLDADATKISVALGAGTCYVKVADNGCGITRDGLVLLGERYELRQESDFMAPICAIMYDGRCALNLHTPTTLCLFGYFGIAYFRATSKFGQLVGTGIITGSFGFRGEALSSIANVSLVEVITKAHGRPNGYRKVMKGCKCLYIGIDDGRQDVGTTVIVRDLFYNQPVRRKHIQSSTTKVLQSVKKCVFRISLLYPKVSFKVVDIESDVELFCTTPSSSPLTRLMSGFGVEVTNLLRELNVTDGGLKLSGYMSSPCDTSSVKAFQYVYINSRYICKGTIHKLLNQLISGFNTSQHQKVNMGSQIAKRIRIQTCSNFILNLSCPRSWYDITFEPSKTSVDFKACQDHKPTVVEEEDWNPIINFIEKAITHFWSEIFSSDIFQGDALSDGIGVPPDNVRREAGHASAPGEDFPPRCRTARRKSRVQNHVDPISLPSPRLEMQNEEQDILAYHEDNKISCPSIPYFKHQTELGHVYQSDSSVKSFDELLALSRVTVDREIGSYHNAAGYSFLSSEDHFVGNKFFATEKSKEHTDNVLNSSFEDDHIKMDANIRNGYLESYLPYDPFEIGSNVDNTTKEFKEPFLRSCTSQKIRLLDEESLMSSEVFDSPIDRLRCKRTCGMLTELNFSSQNSGKSSLSGASFSGGWGLDRENDLQVDSAVQMRQLTSTNWFSDSIMSSPLSDSVFGTKYHGFESSPVKNACREYETSAKYDYLADRDNMDRDFHFDDIISSTPSRENCSLLNGTNIHSDVRNRACICEDNFGFLPQHNPYDVTFPRSSDMFNDETNWLSSDLCGKYDGNCHATTSRLIPSSIYFDEGEGKKSMEEYFWKQRPRRSHSAPPLYRGKKKFFALNNHLTTEAGKRKNHKSNNACTSQEKIELKHLKRSSDVRQLDTDSNSMKDLLAYTRKDKEGSDPSDLHFNCMSSVKDIQDPVVPELKWRGGYTKTANRDNSHNTQKEDTILDVSSGLLHLAGDSLVPDSIYKNFLKDAKVLQQVDKKFIPVVGNGFLSIIDQHAADERIRLEELRHKVLSGEKKTITYLDSEQKLVMPEIGYQLLHNYAEQIQKWGWLCNFHAQDSRSFKKNLNILHKQPTSITLIAVPCILGVNLTDVDLLEFLQQLADTDGSSTIPPSVHRILNSKACRGAIMFGDTLLPSECSLIVEELKRTSLCFQCAHGRPTTAPLVNLEALYKQIEKLGSWNDGSDVWHGLRRHAPSLERARHRLSSARQ